MMAYDKQFVLCVLHNGHPIREINGTVSIPFGEEYKIRLKNKHSYLRAKARVWVDGRQASNLGDFILSPGQTMDLERFLDNNMDSGYKFKFVRLNDSRVNDPTDPDNGIIKVEFYREVDYVKDLDIKIDPQPWKPVKPWDGTDATHWVYTNATFTGGGGTSSCSSSYNTVPCSARGMGSVNYVCDSYVDPSAGATVGGDASNQSFVYGDTFSTEVFPTTLTLKLKGISEPTSPPDKMMRRQRGLPKLKKVRFCSHCARRRSRMADKFCPRCGNPY